MKLFRRPEYYTILADEVSNHKVQKIAGEVGLKHQVTDILYIGDGQCLITFATKERRETLFARLDKTFRLVCDIYATNNLVTITAKEIRV